jgi:archaemetzincin
MRTMRLSLSRRHFVSGASASLSAALLGCKSTETPHSSAPPPSPPARAAASPPSPVAHDSSPKPPPEDQKARPTTADAPQAKPNQVIYLKPLGEGLARSTFEAITGALGLYFPAKAVTLPVSPLPKSAYYPPRSRYRAEKLLDYLETITPKDAQVIVGLTSSDISTTKGSYEDWGILGLATLSGRECVISEFRAKRGANDPKHVLDRLLKTVVHEVGHTIGLDHCTNYGCIMEDGKGSVFTTDHELDICADCRKAVGSRLLDVPASFPWSAP